MLTDNSRREPDLRTDEAKNAAWFLLPRTTSSETNMTIVVQRFDPGGDFEEHHHDLEQFFYVTKGRIEMTIAGETAVYEEGDFVSVDREAPHSGRNVHDGISELLIVDYWPSDSDDRIGLD